jgi:hypothetical protein
MMALPKFKWTEQTPGLENKWSEMWNKVTIQRPAGVIDAAGATPKKYPEDWADYIVGHDGNGVSAEITEPTAEDAILAFESNVRLTHKIKVRYDVRIKPGMQATYWQEGRYHKARIHTVTDPEFNQIWMILGAVEQTTQGEEYL